MIDFFKFQDIVKVLPNVFGKSFHRFLKKTDFVLSKIVLKFIFFVMFLHFFYLTSTEESETEDSGTETAEKNNGVEKSKEDEEEKSVSDYSDILPPSPSNIRDSIKQKFLVEMPEDFYQFYEFCKVTN